jgi:RNA polymerase sigma factor (sigma-70 family)
VRQLSTSVFTYVRHHWRVRRREAELDVLALECDRAAKWDPTPSWDEAIMFDEVTSHLPFAISKLPQRQSEVLVSRYFEERSYDDIADEMGIQSATVRSLLRHAINHLRGQFREKFSDDFAEEHETRELAAMH